MHRFLVFALICFIALCAGVFINLPRSEFSLGGFKAFQKEEPVAAIEKTKIRFVGDVMLARNVEYLMDTYGFSYPVSLLPAHPQDAYLVGNFESSIPVDHVPTKSMTFTFSVRPEHLEGMRSYGFTHFGLANNHAYDHGGDDFLHTVNTLEGSSFGVFGDPAALSSSTSISLIDIGTTSVALIGVYAVDAQPPLSDVVSVFKHASEISDVQVAYVHWGTEYVGVHNKVQEKLAHALVDAGADMVVGHHPHVVQDIELYKDAPIFYSLGNFIFDQYFSEEVQEGLMLQFAYDEALQIDLYPVSSLGSKSAPRLMALFDRDAFLDELAEKSSSALRDMIRKGSLTLAI